MTEQIEKSAQAFNEAYLVGIEMMYRGLVDDLPFPVTPPAVGELQQAISEVNTTFKNFGSGLLSFLEAHDTYQVRRILSSQLLILLRDVMRQDYTKQLRCSCGELLDRVDMTSQESIYVISLIHALSSSVRWLSWEADFIGGSAIPNLKETLQCIDTSGGIIVESGKGTDESISAITPDEEIGKNPITRDGVWFLFSMLRQKGVINQMSDTELSDIVSTLTGYSAEKLRQSKLKTQSAKDKLTSLLGGILSKINNGQ